MKLYQTLLYFQNGYTPLHIAAKKNQMDIVSALIDHGAKTSAESKVRSPVTAYCDHFNNLATGHWYERKPPMTMIKIMTICDFK
jgi:ankyrin repeat protein